VQDYLSKKAKRITPYIAGEQMNGKDIVKLNTNENPYPASQKVFDAISRNINADLKKYPKPDGGAFKTSAAKNVGVGVENIFCGNGSDEVLALAFQAFFDTDRVLSMPEITYSFYPVWADLYDIPVRMIPLKADFSIDETDYYNSESVIIPNPNAPTGVFLGLDGIRKILDNNKSGVVIIDEAYIDFGGQSAVPLIFEYENLLVVRTLSKGQSLAGMRAGFAVANKALIDGLNRIKDSFNSYPINRLTSVAAAAALEDTVYYDKINEAIIKTREWSKKALKALGFFVVDSKANFVFVSHEKIAAKTIYEKLKQKKVLVRWFNKDKIDNYLRISIGTDDEMKKLLAYLEAIL
jgi:histidinol-phosphate aminotransferase